MPYSTPDGEWWWDPYSGMLIPCGDHQIWKYDIYIDSDNAFIQQGNPDLPLVYWLDVYVETDGSAQFGWKTSIEHFNEDAVLFNENMWRELRYPEQHPQHPESVDMAFEITTEPVPEPNSDLGDAPDSTNNHGQPMTAYPSGVQGNYPTVYDDGMMSSPVGPLHRSPLSLAYLGRSVSLEIEADIGVDQDPSNNIDPLNDTADLDGADDCLVNLPLNLPHCRWSNFDYLVTVVSPGTDLYVNAWLDWNRDGDWDDSFTCPNGQVPEWAVQNQLLTSLPVGAHMITSPAFLSWHPVDTPQDLWMRITLSAQPWRPMGLTGASAGGGAGPTGGYTYGETEDYYIEPDTSCWICPDLNCDRFVNFLDFAIMANKWLDICP